MVREWRAIDSMAAGIFIFAAFLPPISTRSFTEGNVGTKQIVPLSTTNDLRDDDLSATNGSSPNVAAELPNNQQSTTDFQNYVTLKSDEARSTTEDGPMATTRIPELTTIVNTSETPTTKSPLLPPYPGGNFPSKPFRLEPAPVIEEVEDFSPFEANKQSILQWIASLLSGFGVGHEHSPAPPAAIDQSKCEPCSCGLTNKKNRIVGGIETEINEYPWMGLLTYHGEFYCGCTLINHKYVLTAAHCVSGFRASKIRVILLEHNQKLDNETTVVERGVSKIYRHSGYSTVSLDNDIALIKLDNEVNVNDEFMPVCLPPLKKSFAGETGIVTGWGVTSAGKIRGDDIRAHISPVLQEVEVPIMTNDACRDTGYMKNQITENMLCAGYKEGGKDSCQGDSGGPLHIANGNTHHIVGVVSWGQGCARPNYPGIYCRVNRYLPWIQKYTADSCQCNNEAIIPEVPDESSEEETDTIENPVKEEEKER